MIQLCIPSLAEGAREKPIDLLPLLLVSSPILSGERDQFHDWQSIYKSIKNKGDGNIEIERLFENEYNAGGR